jgi:alpha-tubulin suppressor-like RCC1 family protein
MIYGMGRRNWNQYFAVGVDPTNVAKDFIDLAKPCKTIATGAKITQISAGFNHAVYVLDDNRVYCSGFNYYGQCGLSNLHTEILDKYAEVEIPLDNGELVKEVACGYNHNILLTSNNRVFFWGNVTKNQFPGFLEKYGKGLTFAGPVEMELPLEGGEFPIRVKASFNRSLVFLSSGRVLAIGGENTTFWYGLPALAYEDISAEFKDRGLQIKDAALGLWHSAVIASPIEQSNPTSTHS